MMNLSVERARELDAMVALVAEGIPADERRSKIDPVSARLAGARHDDPLVQALAHVARAAGVSVWEALMAVRDFPKSEGRFEARVVDALRRREQVDSLIAQAKARAARRGADE